MTGEPKAFDAAQFKPLRRGAAERILAVGSSEFVRRGNGLEAFTPDGLFLLGPAPQVRGIRAACVFYPTACPPRGRRRSTAPTTTSIINDIGRLGSTHPSESS